MALRLYSYFRSGSSWRVRIALNLKGIEYSIVPIHLVKGQQNTPEFRAVSPQGMVPALLVEEGGVSHTLTQSMAIIEYLEETHPSPPLLPADPFGRARVRQLSEIVNSSIQPLQNLSVLNKVGDELKGDRKAWAADFIGRGLGAFEKLASELPAAYAVGDRPTVADAFLVPQLFAARRFDVDLAQFPTCLAIESTCSKLEAFQAARPENQPDAER
jgi:maleylpyruvate isomerase